MRLAKRLSTVLLIAAAQQLQAQLPPGYYAEHTPSLPDSLRERYSQGRFTISIVRLARDSTERVLLARAEGLIPPADSIEQAAAPMREPGYVAAFKKAKEIAGDRWWWLGFDNVLLPYALTGSAVLYYVETVRAFAGGLNRLAGSNQRVVDNASIEYTAAVESRGAGGARRVRMQVQFSFYCGPLCALSFSHSRVVEFDAAGNPIRVGGDRPPSYIMS